MSDSTSDLIFETIIEAAKNSVTELNFAGLIVMTPPIIVKELAIFLDVKPFLLIQELMALDVFVGLGMSIETDIAEKVAAIYGKTLRVEAGSNRYQNSQMRELPPEIGLCRELNTLRLDNCNFETLPPSILHCQKLRRIFLHGNPKLGIPPEILGPTWSEVESGGKEAADARGILNYYFTKDGESAKPLNEARLVFVGRGAAGKTSLIHQLIYGVFEDGKTETLGVDLTDWPVRIDETGEVLVHIWDFAGQTITHSMHEFFLSVRTIYILVLTGRENSEREDAEYWLRLISAYGTDESGNGPPVIVALNKWDDPGSAKAKIDRGALQERYPFIKDFVCTDCKTGTGISEIKNKIVSLLWSLPIRVNLSTQPVNF